MATNSNILTPHNHNYLNDKQTKNNTKHILTYFRFAINSRHVSVKACSSDVRVQKAFNSDQTFGWGSPAYGFPPLCGRMMTFTADLLK